ncbi:hypothetical protein AX16_003283 [Volvariella volvacea WC 439]|nr:hypothetical protein AX16_003283 [Volvariella volvacea WC 439]
MSDNEQDIYDRDAPMDDAEHDEGGYDEEEEQTQKKASKSKSRREYDDDDEEEEEDDEEDDDEEDEEDEEDPGRKRKRTKHRHRRPAASRFLDIEAEVSDDDEEEEDGELEGGETFVDDDFDDGDRATHHALLDKKRQLDEEEDKSPEQIARDLSRRYGQQRAVRYTGDMNEIPQRLLMPSVHDASLWQVRVKPGREREIVFSLMRKAIDLEFTAQPLAILSAFQRDSLPGIIYVEARSSAQVNKACQGLVGVYPSRGIQLVPIEEMASLLQIKKQEQTITPGSWVRMRRGKYQGDLAQVMDIAENGEDVGLRFIPRIDLRPRDDSLDGSKKRKKNAPAPGNIRPPQRLFNPDEVAKVYGRSTVLYKSGTYLFQGDTYRDGFIEKDFKISALALDDVNPTLEEITQFSKKLDGGQADGVVDLSVIAEASRKAAIQVLQPGDHVEVFEGEQAGVHGVVEEINQDVVTITAVGVDIEGQKIELPARSVRKRFKPGDHVKVMTGHNADETGLVVAVSDNVVTFLSDMSLQEVSVFSKDLREAAEVGSSTNVVGNYELHDLVQLDAQTVGVIYKTERDSFRVLDQNGQVRLVQPHQISMRRDSNRAIATDSEGHEIRINDNMKEIDGEGRKGRVLHIHQSFFAFLHNREIVENGGVFVTRTRSLVSVAPKGSIFKPGTDLSKMNPSLAVPVGGMVGSGVMGRGPRDRHIGLTVVIIKGAQKGYVGTIKDTNGNMARVELRTGNKIISIEKDKLYKRISDGKLAPLNSTQHGMMGPPMDRFGSRTPQAGGRTPSGAAVGRTPNPYQDSRTPAWNASSRTPNPYALDGGKTPAWNASSRTPNPYADGGRTPAWNASSRTPNPYASGGGGAAGWQTPKPNSWGDSTPSRSGGGAGGGWGTSPEGWTSPQRTPVWGETWSAPTPGVIPAATPAFAPTPFSAPTPAASTSWVAPTPGVSFSGALGAPTPGANFGFHDSLDKDIPFTLDPSWLLDEDLAPVLTRMKVVVKGTRAPDYLHGQYEERLGRVKSVSRAGTNNPDQQFEAYATIDFGSGDERVIPVRFLQQVTPLLRMEDAVVLDGELKGKTCTIYESPSDAPADKIVVQSKDNASSFFEVRKDVLAVLYKE